MAERAYLRGITVKGLIFGSAAAAVLCVAPAAFAQDDVAVAGEAETTAALAPGVETPWYEAFTLSMNGRLNPALELESTYDWESPGGFWGLRVGIQDNPDLRSDLGDVSAGAFINLGDRIRLGGQVRFTSPDDEIFRLTENGDRQPEIKFESALRF